MYGALITFVLEDILKCKTPDRICIVSTSIVAGLDKAKCNID